MRDAFAVLFFVSMGMLFDPTRLLADMRLTVGTIAIVLLAKPLAALAVVLLLKRPLRVALVVAVALAQIGEFSFMLATVGRQLGVLPPAATQVLVISAIVSITLNPFLFRAVEPLLAWLGSRNVVAATAGLETETEGDDTAEPLTIVVGYGPVGRMVTRLLRENHIDVVVIELNYQTVQQLHAQHIRAVHGDAAQAEILRQAGMERASGLIFAASGTPPESVIRMAKDLNPDAMVLARSAYLNEVDQLRSAGAHIIVAAEAEVALAMTERVLVELGATPEQLDRERSRVRRSLFPVAT